MFPRPRRAAGTAARAGRDLEEQPGSVAELEHELQYVKESQQTTVEELETSNEELKSTNEELQSTNEELQSTNEELETSKEEMQSLNEELGTVNTELQAKVEELSRATDDMQNLLNSIQVATIFLDDQLNVKRYTEAAQELFNLIPTRRRPSAVRPDVQRGLRPPDRRLPRGAADPGEPRRPRSAIATAPGT